jgi:demethylmenaquinone methyltransferase/2-methoxy-6-polyprenyl-1,4-benzoquinol methylase
MVILDIGCGTGAQLDLYKHSGAMLLGIDQSPAMLGRARRRLARGAALVRADASRIPYPDSSVDLILLSLALHELAEETRRNVLVEARRVLKAEGRILVLDYHAGPSQFPCGWVAKAVIMLLERCAGRDHYRHYRTFLAGGGVPASVAAYGFQVEKHRAVKSGSLGLFLLRRVSVTP